MKQLGREEKKIIIDALNEGKTYEWICANLINDYRGPKGGKYTKTTLANWMRNNGFRIRKSKNHRPQRSRKPKTVETKKSANPLLVEAETPVRVKDMDLTMELLTAAMTQKVSTEAMRLLIRSTLYT